MRTKKINYYISISFILITLTGLRIPGISLGIGEILLLACLLIKFSGPRANYAINVITHNLVEVYWGILLTSLLFGMIVNIVTPTKTVSYSTLLAYIFGFLISLCLASYCTYEDVLDIIKKTARIGTFFFFWVYLYSVIVGQTIFGIPLYFRGGARFTGGAKNPNQLALFLLAIPYVALAFLIQAISDRKKRESIRWGGVLVVSVFLGFMTGSDALIGSWAIGLMYLLYRTVLKRIRRVIPRLCVLGVCMTVFVLLFYGKIVDFLLPWYYSADEGGDRLKLWMEGLEAAKESFFVGYGPGSFCGVRNSEAHNTIIDFLTQGGMLAVFALIYLFCTTYKYIKINPILSSSFATLITYSMAHFIGRQPIFYLYFVFFAFAGLHDRRNVYSQSCTGDTCRA